MPDMQHRAVAAVREHDAAVSAAHGDDAVWVAVSHGDVIKAVLADALGMHLDAFQRIVADPCSVSIVRYTPLRPFVLRMNDTGGDLAHLAPPRTGARRRRTRPASSDAVVGGSPGTDHASGPPTP
jgi:broad specificity phosphatase PhoE